MDTISVTDAITLSVLFTAVIGVSWAPGFRAGVEGSAIGPALGKAIGRSVFVVVAACAILGVGIAAYRLVKLCSGPVWELERWGVFFQVRADPADLMPVSCPTCRCDHLPAELMFHERARAAGYLLGLVAPVLGVLAAIPSAATTFLSRHFGTQQRIRQSLAESELSGDGSVAQADGSA